VSKVYQTQKILRCDAEKACQQEKLTSWIVELVLI